MENESESDTKSAHQKPRPKRHWISQPSPRVLMTAAFAATGLYLASASVQAIVSSLDLGVWILPYGLLLLAGVGFLARFGLRPIDIGALSAAVATIWTFVSDSQPFSDFAEFYRLASQFATDHSLESLAAAKSTTTVLFFGTWMDLAGTSVVAARLGGAIALGMTALCVATLGRRLGYPALSWRFAGLAIGLSPAFVTYSPVIASELPFLASLTAGLCALVVSLQTRDPRLWAMTAGLLIGVAYLAVPIGSLFGIAAFIMVAGRWLRSRSVTNRRAVASLLIGLLVFPAAQTLLNWHEAGVVSPSPYPWTALAVLQGTSRECGNGWCPQDLELFDRVGFLDSDVPKADADARAWRLARERWMDDPVGLMSYSLTTKQAVLWGGESQLAYWSLFKSSRYELWGSTGVLDLIRRGIDAYYFAALLLLIPAMIVVARHRVLGWAEAAIALGLAATGFVHIILGVQQRYHLVFMPFVFLLLGLAFSTVQERTGLLRGAPTTRSSRLTEQPVDRAP